MFSCKWSHVLRVSVLILILHVQCMYTYIHVRVSTTWLSECRCLYMYTYIRMYIHIHICSYIYTQTCMYINTLVHIQIHIHTSYACIHTYCLSLWLSLSGNLDVPDRYRLQNTHASTTCLCVCVRLVISLSFVHTHAYTHTLSLTLLHTHRLSHTHTHTHSLSPSLSDHLSASNRHRLQHTRTPGLCVSLCVTAVGHVTIFKTYTHTLSLSHSLSHTQATWTRQTLQPCWPRHLTSTWHKLSTLICDTCTYLTTAPGSVSNKVVGASKSISHLYIYTSYIHISTFLCKWSPVLRVSVLILILHVQFMYTYIHARC